MLIYIKKTKLKSSLEKKIRWKDKQYLQNYKATQKICLDTTDDNLIQAEGSSDRQSPVYEITPLGEGGCAFRLMTWV